MSCFQPRCARYLTQRLAVSAIQHGPSLLGQRGTLLQSPSTRCVSAWRACSTSVYAGTGMVVGFGRQGWPLVRLGAENTEGPVILVDPGEAVLVRGQLLKLEDGKILELLEGPKKKKCVHPTRVAGLCKTCPRRKGKLSRWELAGATIGQWSCSSQSLFGKMSCEPVKAKVVLNWNAAARAKINCCFRQFFMERLPVAEVLNHR